VSAEYRRQNANESTLPLSTEEERIAFQTDKLALFIH